jgi:exosortase A
MSNGSGAGMLALAALVGVLAVFWPTTAALLELWMDTDRPYSHGMLVGPIAAWLATRECRDAWRAPAARSWLALLLFIGASLCWVAAFSVDVLIGQQLLLSVLLVLAVATTAGWPMARKLAFPAGFLYFAVPVWSAATGTLQGITVAVVGAVLDLVAIPLYVEGNFITIPEGVFEVAGGCAGLHFFIVALTIASLQAYLYVAAPWRRLALIGAAALVALVTNWVRVGSLVAIGHYSDMQHYLITHDHYYYGWVLFAIALVPLFVVARRLAEEDGVDPTDAATSSVRAEGRWRWHDTAIVGLLVAVSSLPLSFVHAGRGDVSAGSLELTLPEGKDGWRLAAPGEGPVWEPSFVGADGSVLARYVRDGVRVDVYLAVYRSQRQGRELVSEQNRLFSADDRRVSERSVALAGVQRPAIVREQITASPHGTQRVVWYWYAVGPRLVVDDLQAKLWHAVGRIRGGDSGAVAAISVVCGRDCNDAGGGLVSFLEAMAEPLVTASLAQQAESVR